MSEPFQPANKAALLTHIQAEYDRFETLLASLREEQMTTPGVHGTWSVKDDLAHLTVWQDYQTTRLQGVLSAGEPLDPLSGLGDEDAQNEYYYQQFKDQPLAEVLARFRTSYHHVLAATESLSWEAINTPFPWDNNDVPVRASILGNTSGHYEEHGELIRQWLEKQ
jgi:hypothetical protein